MSQISEIENPWRALLKQQASFRGVMFHVETGARSSGRRTVVHEYPKRNDPYAEDMGRQALRFQFSGYLIYKPASGEIPPGSVRYDYVAQRKKLYEALEKDDAAMLVHPVFVPGGKLVVCERFTMTESRERGGYTQFEMAFVEAGKPVSATGVAPSTTSNVDSSATSAETSGVENFGSTSGIVTPPNASGLAAGSESN